MGKLDIFLAVEVRFQSYSLTRRYWHHKLTLVKLESKSLRLFKVNINMFSFESLENVPDYLTSRAAEWQFSLFRSYASRKLQCRISKISNNQQNSIAKLLELEVIQQRQFNIMLTIVFKNGSNTNPCKKEPESVEFYVKLENRMVHNSSIPSNTFITNYRFVSCGRAEDTVLPFHELVSSFELSLWISILIFLILLVPLILTYFPTRISDCTQSHNQNMMDMLVASLKLILEQGNPFTTATINIPSLKWILSATFLACLEISNAYKRDNILKMIQPRGKIPYEY